MPLRNRLAAIFLPTRRLLAPDPVVLQQGGLLGPVEWIVPRGECRYRRIDFSQLPSRQRHSAAAIAARREEWAPDATSRIAWTGGIAHVWTRRPRRANEPRNWLPESLAQPAPLVDGPRLVACIDGAEGQVWRERMLVASQWWAQAPGPEEWRRFLRGAGIAPDAHTAVPEPRPLGWSKPWAEVRGATRSPDMLERVGWRVVLGGLALVLGWQVAAYLRWSDAMRTIEARTATARNAALPLIEARERADAAVARTLRLTALQVPGSDYVLMAEILAPLPQDARLSAWQRLEDKLVVGVVSAETDPRVFVGAYATHPRLARVQAVPTAAGAMQLTFDLAPAAPAEART